MIRGALMSLLVVISLGSSRVTAISCFSCSSTFNVTNTESSVTSCGSAADQNVATYDYCTTSYTTQLSSGSLAGGIITTIRRSGGFGTQATFCDSTGTCYCNTDKCNGDPVRAPTGLTCYQCSSVDYMDNGCGEVLNAGSKYVQTVQGCSACGKTVSLLGNDYIRRYWRGCARSVNTAEACSGTDMYNRLCVCKTSLCNSGRGLRLSAITFGVSAILATLKISC